jgi:phosphoribosyl 1,2-cyclic phosphodiesterase
MLKFISFGSGSSGNCYFLYTENDGLLIDVGVGIRTLKKHFRDYGLSLTQVRRVLVTHDHADHIKSVGSISHDLHLPVYATAIVHNGIDRNYCVTRKVNPADRHLVEPGKTVQLGDFLVTPFTVPHDSSDNVGYFLEAGNTTFCIITDAGMVTSEMAGYINRAHYLVIEANHDVEMLEQGSYPQHLKKRILSGTGHLSNTNCGEAIVQNMSESLRHVWLCHLSEENNHPELARKTVESVLRSYGIIAGKDFELEVLKRTVPTGIYELI